MIKTVIFDFGGVLIDWNPKYLFKKIFNDEVQMDHFLENVCTSDWNEEQDAGRSLAEATSYLVERFPEHREHIEAYYGRWEEMLGGIYQGTVDILKEVKDSKRFMLLGLTNWSAETFPVAQEKYEFLNWFDGVVVSGEEKSRKPFAEFYHILLSRYNVKPEEAVFIDDNVRNLKGAEELGIQTIHFVSSEQLRQDLAAIGVL